MGAKKTACLALLAILLGLASCDDEKMLTAGERLLDALAANGFRISPDQVNARPVNRMLDYQTSECYEAFHRPTTLWLCFHHFKTSTKALEAKAVIDKSRLPVGHYWVSAVRGRSLVMVDAQIKDRPIADKLISVLSIRN